MKTIEIGVVSYKFPLSWCVDVEKEKDSPYYEGFMAWIRERTDETTSKDYPCYGCINFGDSVEAIGTWKRYGEKDSITMVSLEDWHNFYFPNN